LAPSKGENRVLIAVLVTGERCGMLIIFFATDARMILRILE